MSNFHAKIPNPHPSPCTKVPREKHHRLFEIWEDNYVSPKGTDTFNFVPDRYNLCFLSVI